MGEYDFEINGKSYSVGQGTHDNFYYFTCHDTGEESEPYDTVLEAYQAALIWEEERAIRTHDNCGYSWQEESQHDEERHE